MIIEDNIMEKQTEIINYIVQVTMWERTQVLERKPLPFYGVLISLRGTEWRKEWF